MQCFNPQTNQWTMCAPMPWEAHWDVPHMVAMDGKIYTLGVRDNRYGEDVDKYDTLAL